MSEYEEGEPRRGLRLPPLLLWEEMWGEEREAEEEAS